MIQIGGRSWRRPRTASSTGFWAEGLNGALPEKKNLDS
jgi:hypothetical protein